ncbi:MAG TPA: TRAP transporter TatT component family protein, partial [Candidatus Aminicenantes bacterium]|nr:TRAP transporter TatT component family protein [Candidatus Aminicenantes bacterium]
MPRPGSKRPPGPTARARRAAALSSSAALLLALSLGACSLRRLAIDKVAGMLSGSSGGGDAFTSDNDPDLVGDALPFAIKLYETLLAAAPAHEALRLRTGSLYIMYANAFVEAPAEMKTRAELATKESLLARAKNLYLRGRDILFVSIEKRNPRVRRQL